MCLFPKLLLNPKYKPNKKNNFNPPQLIDERLKYVSVGCGNCIECRKQKARNWCVRLNEEIKLYRYKYFVTLTFAPDALNKLCKQYNMNECNAVATKAVRLMLERYRKSEKKPLRHWFITEMGHENTERIHLHGIIFRDTPLCTDELEKLWSYGKIDIGQYCNERTINYIVKYITKLDSDHKGYVPTILCSAGLGQSYVNTSAHVHAFNRTHTRDYYTLPNGQRVNLPIYYRNKLFTEQEREELWLQRIDEHTIYVRGIPCYNIDSAEGQRNYYKVLQGAQETNSQLGYGDDSKEWRKRDYNVTLRMLNKLEKIKGSSRGRAAKIGNTDAQM